MKKLVVMACLLLAGAQAVATEKVSFQAKQVAQQQGRARVVVLMDDVGAGAAGTPRNLIAKEQRLRRQGDAVLGTLPAAGYRLHRRFARVPALVIEADADILRRLERNVWVRKVDVDRGGTGGAVAADESSVLNRVDLLQGVGLDGTGIKVAVVDTGVDTDHPDLVPRVVAQQCFCSRLSGSGGCCPNGQATQSGAGAAEDDHGHGTNVSGIMVGAGNVAPRGALPAAQLVAVKVLDGGNSFCCTSDVIAALDWIATRHPDTDVVNLSLGTWDLFAGACDASASYLTALKSAVDTLNAQGTVVVASSGNQGDLQRMAAPACLSNVLGVAATWDMTAGSTTFLGCTETSRSPRQPTCFSNRSTTTALFAAGAFVQSAGLNGGLSSYGGTSQAAPMVAACAAALHQAAPLATPYQRMAVMQLSPLRLNDAASGGQYPFLDCLDAAKIFDPARFLVRMNGSQPLIPSRPAPTSPAAAIPVLRVPGDGRSPPRPGRARVLER
ncbi:MAG TPA: S8 family serine peptidase [Pseudoxanthomonas sp.]